MVDIRYTHELQFVHDEDKICASCGHKERAFVQASGTGTAKAGLLFGDHDNARQTAGTNAFMASIDQARTRVDRARCPRCGTRGGKLGLALSRAFGSIVPAGVIAAGPQMCGAHDSSGAAVAAMTLAMLAWPAFTWLFVRAEQRNVDRSVVFASERQRQLDREARRAAAQERRGAR